MNDVKIANGIGSDIVQFSVLLDNKVGSALNFIRFLQNEEIFVLALNVVDNSETSVLRFVTNYQDDTEMFLTKNRISFKKTNVFCVELSRIDQITQILQKFFEAEVSFHYFYTFLIPHDKNSAVIFSTENNQLCSKIITQMGIKLLSNSDISR